MSDGVGGGMMMMRLRPGKFFLSKDGEVWCCYRVRPDKEEHAAADCVRVSDSRLEYFYLDGRYDEAGKREHTLVAEVKSDGTPFPSHPDIGESISILAFHSGVAMGHASRYGARELAREMAEHWERTMATLEKIRALTHVVVRRDE